MMIRGLRFKSDGITCINEEARMLVAVGGEGVVPMLSAVQNVRKCGWGFEDVLGVDAARRWNTGLHFKC